MHQHDTTLERLDDQIAFYERETEIFRRRLKWLKGIHLVAAGAMPSRRGSRHRERWTRPSPG
jgi:hypothetical protein